MYVLTGPDVQHYGEGRQRANINISRDSRTVPVSFEILLRNLRCAYPLFRSIVVYHFTKCGLAKEFQSSQTFYGRRCVSSTLDPMTLKI